MELSRVAAYFDKTQIDVFDDAAGLWIEAEVTGQFKLADDFISIFNRPTRRRMLFLSPDEYDKMKNNSLIREPVTGLLYLFGEPQFDLLEDPYRVTLPLHKVLLQTTVTRRATIGGAGDPGVLVDTALTPVYADIELRTLADDGDTDNSLHSKQFIWLPKNADVVAGDVLVFDGITYIVQVTYQDTGFLGARITSEPDSRVDFTYRQRTGDPTFNNSTGVYTPNYSNFFISAELDSIEEESDDGDIVSDTLYTVFIEYLAIGFTPNIGDAMVIDSDDRIIVKLTRERHLESWKVILR